MGPHRSTKIRSAPSDIARPMGTLSTTPPSMKDSPSISTGGSNARQGRRGEDALDCGSRGEPAGASVVQRGGHDLQVHRGVLDAVEGDALLDDLAQRRVRVHRLAPLEVADRVRHPSLGENVVRGELAPGRRHPLDPRGARVAAEPGRIDGADGGSENEVGLIPLATRA